MTTDAEARRGLAQHQAKAIARGGCRGAGKLRKIVARPHFSDHLGREQRSLHQPLKEKRGFIERADNETVIDPSGIIALRSTHVHVGELGKA